MAIRAAAEVKKRYGQRKIITIYYIGNTNTVNSLHSIFILDPACRNQDEISHMNSTAICILEIRETEETMDLEIPLDISAAALILALRQTFQSARAAGEPKDSYLKCENPLALLHGSRTLREWGVRDGTILHLDPAAVPGDGYAKEKDTNDREQIQTDTGQSSSAAGD